MRILMEVPKMAVVRDIFCDECKHYKESVIFNGDKLKDKCFHPKVFNREKYEKGTPIRKGFLRRWTYPSDCYFMNTNNNCLLFEEQDRRWSTHRPDWSI